MSSVLMRLEEGLMYLHMYVYNTVKCYMEYKFSDKWHLPSQ